MEIILKTGEENVSLMSEYSLLTTIHLPWFFIHVIIIPLKMHRGMNGIKIYMICILIHNYDNWDGLWIIRITNGSNCNWSNLMIIYASNVDIIGWGHIDGSNILANKYPIRTVINQILKMCVDVGWRINKLGVTWKYSFPSILSSSIYCVKYKVGDI